MLTIERRSLWLPLAAGTWSAVYACLGLWWSLGHAGFPFGAAPDSWGGSAFLAGARAATGAPLIAVLGAAGAVVAMLLARSRPGDAVRAALLAFAWTMACALLVLVPDARSLIGIAVTPIFLLGAPFGWPPMNYSSAVPWPVLNQYLCIAGGALWASAALAFARRTRGACVACGRGAGQARWSSPAAAARWGRWAAWVAALIPVMYAETRIAWELGIPLGISDEFLREGQANGMWHAGAAFSAVALSGAVLTLGLVSSWGEHFPRWLPRVGGRRVPPMLAIAPASLVSVVILGAGLEVVRGALRDGLRSDQWSTLGPGLLWPIWGLSLAAATLAYHYRRRGSCARCRRS